MLTLVSVDIETTGLDSQKDAILEIGAVRFNGRRVEAEWESLINPGRTIPPFITQLTGITNQMVAQAPTLRDVFADLRHFVGDAPIVGHNVRFDLSFLRRKGAFELNDVVDTYEMAAILLPSAERYNLGALAQALAVPLPATHRALDDALVTHGIYLRLHEIALDLPIELLAEIVRMSEPLEWGGYWAFREALRERSKETVRARKVGKTYYGPLFSERRERALSPLRPNVEIFALDEEEVAAVLEHGGAFSRHFPYFEHRPQQVEMLRAIAQALSESRHLMVEASTGVGKSLAYLVPAALWALQNNTRVVVSTNTINLQDQLINKDIPDVREALGIELRAAVLKGRSNYLCPRRLEIFRRRGPETADEIRVLAKIMTWLRDSGTGDRGDINLNGPVEREIWGRISAEDEGCTSENCLQRTGGACPFYRARQAAQSAHILIVNHALLLADVATGNRVLPEYDYLIVDEAHHLEEATTNALSFRVTQYEMGRLLRELGGPKSGVLGWCLGSLEGVLSPSDFAAVNQIVQQATDLAFRFENQARQFFITINDFLAEQRDGRPVGTYAHQERILPATRTQPAWEAVEIIWDDAQQTLHALLENVAHLAELMANLLESLPEESLDLYTQLTDLYRRLKEVQDNLNALVFDPDEGQIYWAEIQPDGRKLSLHAAPLHIGPLMERYLWYEKAAVILTSATLTAAGEFDYLRGRLYARDAYELALGSPFDYESAALLYVPNDIPEPSDRHGFQRAINQSLIRLCRATGGRALVLFTSYAQLRSTSQAIAPALAENDIQVYEQGEGASPHALLESFRIADKAVLLGTRAFWEGVDVPGEALSVLVIVKLPFDVPSDPIIASRSETFEDPFYQYALPEAILRFRQGFGRLIRTQYDRGVVAILDRRVLTKRYGRLFIDSLPPCSVQVGALMNLPKAAARWLNL
ncbi:MAG: helicase C-terminal domain-containing protein [Anaerolineales bacterium]